MQHYVNSTVILSFTNYTLANMPQLRIPIACAQSDYSGITSLATFLSNCIYYPRKGVGDVANVLDRLKRTLNFHLPNYFYANVSGNDEMK